MDWPLCVSLSVSLCSGGWRSRSHSPAVSWERLGGQPVPTRHRAGKSTLTDMFQWSSVATTRHLTQLGLGVQFPGQLGGLERDCGGLHHTLSWMRVCVWVVWLLLNVRVSVMDKWVCGIRNTASQQFYGAAILNEAFYAFNEAGSVVCQRFRLFIDRRKQIFLTPTSEETLEDYLGLI